MNIDINPNTIILLVGPPGCGKTTFAKNVLIPQLKNLKPLAYRNTIGVSYISSDDIRAELIGDDVPRHDARMTAMSAQAFKILFQKIESAASFPVSTEFIIVDTKGLSKEFRERVFGLSKEKFYNVLPVLFQFKDVKEYYQSDLPGYVKKSIDRDLKKMQGGFRRELLSNGAKPVTISSRAEASSATVTSELHDVLASRTIPDKETLCIGDVHGCYGELVELLKKKNIEVSDTGEIIRNEFGLNIVLLGDFLDKGPEQGKCLRFVAANIDRSDLFALFGNHEVRARKEIIDGEPRAELKEYFDAVEKLSEEEKNLFKEIYPKLLPFVRNSFMVATHCPCDIKYADKLGRKAEYMMSRGFHWTDVSAYESVEAMLEKELNLFREDICTTYHVFGHVPAWHPGSKNGRILVDGGCVVGGELRAVKLSPWGRPGYISVPSMQPHGENLLPFHISAPKVEDFDPSPEEEIKLAEMANHKVSFISGTMSPCPQKDGVLESISSAVDYFRSRSVNNVVMQCKYMGSRCNVYLTHDDSTSYAVSRRGHVIKETEKLKFAPIFEKLRGRFAAAGIWDEIEMAIIDGELLPWSALGSGLIGKFEEVQSAVARETMWLNKSGFMRRYAELGAAYAESGFANDARLSKKELEAKHGRRDAETFAAFEAGRKWHISISDMQKGNAVFDSQIKIYGKDGEPYYSPFSILKLVYKDGRETVPGLGGTDWDNVKMFKLLNDDSQFVYDLSADGVVGEIETVFKRLTESLEFEGVVIKPVDVGERRCVPFMKVRNPKYLTIVYGFDYMAPAKHALLCERKDTRGKMRLSKEEWIAGNKMLAIPAKEIFKDNNAYAALAYTIMRSVKAEAGLDPRL